MKAGIDIEFFQSERPDDIEKGKLFIDDDGKDYIEFRKKGIGHYSLIKAIFAKGLDSGEKYTLINCVFRQSEGSSCRYTINELYKGDHISISTENNCFEVEASMTGLTNWINLPRIIPEFAFSNSEDSTITIKNSVEKSFNIPYNTILEISEFCGGIYDKNETILRNKSSIKITSQQPVSRIELHKNIMAFAKLLSVFTDTPVALISERFSFQSSKTVEYLSVREVKGQTEYQNDALLKFDKIEENWQTVLDIFYGDRDKFTRVLDLFIESVKNRTPEVSFLNITTAFEVFHKEFLEKNNKSIRQELFDELKGANLISRDTKKWDQIIRYFHLMKMTGHIEFFKQNFLNPLKTVALLRASRNYYTHYTNPNEEIWTPNRLLFANKALRQLLKGVILLQLEIPSNLINKLLNNRAAVFYQDYENNEYSLLYTNSEGAFAPI